MVLSVFRLTQSSEELISEATSRYVNSYKLIKFNDAINLNIEEKNWLTLDNWKEYLGKPQAYGHYYIFFNNIKQTQNIGFICEKIIPALYLGVPTMMYHPMMRLQFGLELQDNEEIIQSLSFLSAYYQETPVDFINDQEKVIDNPLKMCEEFLSNNVLHFIDFSFGSMADRITKVFKEQQFNYTLKLYNTALQKELSYFLVELYIQTQDFTALHLILAMCSLRNLMSYLTDKPVIEKLKLQFWKYICAAYISIGMPVINETEILK